MPSERADDPRLGYLLKITQQRFAEVVREALAPLGIDTRQWVALIGVDDQRPLSQGEIAERVGIDRTTMVAVVDELQANGLVVRRPHDEDRRKNVVELTAAGRRIRDRAADRIDDAERRFLAVLDESDARQLKKFLRTLTS